MSPAHINSADEVRRVLASACAGREVVYLVTPYIRFETNFLKLEADAIHVRISMGAEEAIYALRSTDLRMRFPAGAAFLEGQTRTLGFGMADGKRSIRLALPKSFKDDDHRAAYRVERVGRVEVTFSTPHYDLGTAQLVNLSVTGAKINCLQDLEAMDIRVNGTLTLGFTLNEEIRINAPARVAWLQGRILGLAFEPVLPETVLIPLTRWVFKKREEDLERVERGGSGEGMPILPAKERKGVVLVSSSKELEAELREGWGELPPLRRADPVAQSLKEALAEGPALLLFHVPSASLDTRRRLKMLVEAAGRTPFMILGSGVDQAALFDLGNELKAAGVFGLLGKPSAFFFRLVAGILRRHAEGAES